MTPTPIRDTPKGRAHNDLRNLARTHHRDAAEYFTHYVIMAAFATRRPGWRGAASSA